MVDWMVLEGSEDASAVPVATLLVDGGRLKTVLGLADYRG